MADPGNGGPWECGSGGPWEWRTLGVVSRYRHQRADERHGKPSRRYPGAISGQQQSWKTPGEYGVSKSMGCDIFHSVL